VGSGREATRGERREVGTPRMPRGEVGSGREVVAKWEVGFPRSPKCESGRGGVGTGRKGK
jgi:hypothetical protein